MSRLRGPAANALIVGLLGVGTACVVEDSSDAPTLPDGIEAISFRGDSLRPPPLDSAMAAQRMALLREAQRAHASAPDNPDSIIGLGRRLAYLGHYRDAIEVYSRGLEHHPEDARLYRHRGHRYITTRELDRAVADFERAAQLVAGQPDRVEPDGLPNARGIPTSTLQTNIWYHLGLAHYLLGDFEAAAAAYRECLELSANPDMAVATSYWYYMTLRRLGRFDEAQALLTVINPDMDIIENLAYQQLLLMYKGEIDAVAMLEGARSADAIGNATIGYGVGNWHHYNGRETQANQVFHAVLSGPQWAAFGYIAAEAEVARTDETGTP
jgi:tetratricopeptide (TPR) repeat protein